MLLKQKNPSLPEERGGILCTEKPQKFKKPPYIIKGKGSGESGTERRTQIMTKEEKMVSEASEEKVTGGAAPEAPTTPKHNGDICRDHLPYAVCDDLHVCFGVLA